MNNQEYQIAKLNSMVKICLAPSKIHGVGVFALRDISKGEKIYADHFPEVFKIPYASFGKLFPEVKEIICQRFPRVVQNEPFAFPTDRSIAYMNHSNLPNYSANKDEAMRDIAKGEELTEDYRLIPNHEEAYPWLKDESML